MQIYKSGSGVLNIKCREGLIVASEKGVEIDGLLFDGPGEYERKGIFVEGIEPDGFGTLFVIHAEDINLCYAANLTETLSNNAVKTLGDVDILCINIGQSLGLNIKDADKTISTIDPRVVIAINVEQGIDLHGVLGMTREDLDTYKFKKVDLPVEDRKLVVIG